MMHSSTGTELNRRTVRFVMIGGFLGAGKTTAILWLAQHYGAAGRRVAIIANDLAEGLVDTEIYRAHGLPVEEMAGVCFACRFDDLIAAAGRLRNGHRPDILLVEPSGSCTDIVSRVIDPLKRVYANQFQVAPYVTLLDPRRAFEALAGRGPARLSAKVTFLYKMQQNEADIVALNKADTLDPQRRAELTALVARNFPKAELAVVSARTGEGCARLAALVDGKGQVGGNPIDFDDVDTSLSAEGDARLSWLNATWHFARAVAFDADQLVLELAGSVQGALADVSAEPAHVKIIMRSGGDVAIANIVSSDRSPELSRRAGRRTEHAELIINARVEVDPARLRTQIEDAVRRTAAGHHVHAACSLITTLVPDLPGTTCQADLPREGPHACRTDGNGRFRRERGDGLY